MSRSEITLGKIIIDFPDSHKDVAEGLRDKIAEELEDSLNNYKDNSHGVVGQWQDYEDRHDSDAEEFKRESEIMRADDLRDEYKERGLDPKDFWSDLP